MFSVEIVFCVVIGMFKILHQIFGEKNRFLYTHANVNIQHLHIFLLMSIDLFYFAKLHSSFT